MTPRLPPRPARPLFLLDYDGTLAPIVADPAAALPHAAVPDLLARLAGRVGRLGPFRSHLLADRLGFLGGRLLLGQKRLRSRRLQRLQHSRAGEQPRRT